MGSGELTPSANYGDQVKLASMKQAGGEFKAAQGTSGPMVQSAPAGRPTASPEIPQTAVVGEGTSAPPNVPAEHKALIQKYVDARKAYEILAPKAAAANAGPRLKFWANLAARQVTQLAVEVKSSTPDFLA